MRKTENKIYQFKRVKTYKPEEIMAAGGTDAFAKKTGYDPKALYHLEGERITEEEYRKALSMLTK